MKYVFLLFLPLAIVNLSFAQTTPPPPNPEEEKIQELLKDFTRAWNKHDARDFAKTFAEDADFVNSTGVVARGREAIEKHHEPGFKAKWKESRIEITKIKIRFIQPDVAAVDAWWDLTGIQSPTGQKLAGKKGLANFVLKKTGEIWEIVVMHNLDFVPAK